ncbi:MAG: SPOR domain-containing protein [Desulfatibacillaceae bacterium]
MAGGKKDHRKVYEFTGQTVGIVATMILLSWCIAFAVGILVGRDMSPVRFDVAGIQQDLENLRRELRSRNRVPAVRDEGDGFDFYETLPKQDREAPFEPRPGHSPRLPAPLEGTGPESPEPASKTPAPAPAPAPARKPSSAANQPPMERERTVYGVQVGAYTNEKYARTAMDRFEEMGYPAYISQLHPEGKPTLYRIRVGPYETREAADRAETELQNTGAKTLVVAETR